MRRARATVAAVLNDITKKQNYIPMQKCFSILHRNEIKLRICVFARAFLSGLFQIIIRRRINCKRTHRRRFTFVTFNFSLLINSGTCEKWYPRVAIYSRWNLRPNVYISRNRNCRTATTLSITHVAFCKCYDATLRLKFRVWTSFRRWSLMQLLVVGWI